MFIVRGCFAVAGVQSISFALQVGCFSSALSDHPLRLNDWETLARPKGRELKSGSSIQAPFTLMSST